MDKTTSKLVTDREYLEFFQVMSYVRYVEYWIQKQHLNEYTGELKSSKKLDLDVNLNFHSQDKKRFDYWKEFFQDVHKDLVEYFEFLIESSENSFLRKLPSTVQFKILKMLDK